MRKYYIFSAVRIKIININTSNNNNNNNNNCCFAGRLRGLTVACWITDRYHPCSNLGVGISEGCLTSLHGLPCAQK